MVGRVIGWRWWQLGGLLLLLPCMLTGKVLKNRWIPPPRAVRMSEPQVVLDCTFIKLCDTALFGLNDKTIRDVRTAEECKQACLEETEFACLSVDYITDSWTCYLSSENAITQAVHIGPHFGADHYSYVCDPAQAAQVGFTDVEGTDCGFSKQCGLALFGFNTKTIDYVALDECMRACIDETEFDCLSFDYSTDSQTCFLSEESAATQPAHMGPHFGADYYQKMCVEPQPEYGSGGIELSQYP